MKIAKNMDLCVITDYVSNSTIFNTFLNFKFIKLKYVISQFKQNLVHRLTEKKCSNAF